MADASENDLNDDDSNDDDYEHTRSTRSPRLKTVKQVTEESGRVPYSSAQLRANTGRKQRIVAENKLPLQYWSPQQKTFIYEKWKGRQCSGKEFATLLKAEGIKANMWDETRIINANIVAGIVGPLRRREADEKGEITPAPAILSHHQTIEAIAESPVPVSETSSPEEPLAPANGHDITKVDDSQPEDRMKLLAAEPPPKRQRSGTGEPSTPPPLSQSQSASDDANSGHSQQQRSHHDPVRNHYGRRHAMAHSQNIDHLEGQLQLCREEVRTASLKVDRIINVLKLLSAAKSPPPAQN